MAIKSVNELTPDKQAQFTLATVCELVSLVMPDFNNHLRGTLKQKAILLDNFTKGFLNLFYSSFPPAIQGEMKEATQEVTNQYFHILFDLLKKEGSRYFLGALEEMEEAADKELMYKIMKMVNTGKLKFQEVGGTGEQYTLEEYQKQQQEEAPKVELVRGWGSPYGTINKIHFYATDGSSLCQKTRYDGIFGLTPNDRWVMTGHECKNCLKFASGLP